MNSFSKHPGLHLKVVREVGEIINSSGSLACILDSVVWHLSGSLSLDVVSIYIFEEKQLVLRATRGLNFDKKNPITMPQNEGLTGRVFSHRHSLSVKHASRHPDYKFFKDSGEQEFETYVGVPILLGNRCLGVLVGQYAEARTVHAPEETLFEIIASRIAGLLEVADRLDRLREKSSEQGSLEGRRGRGVSPGFAVGKVHLVRGLFRNMEFAARKYGSLREETERLEQAFLQSESEIAELVVELQQRKDLSASEIRIFEAHAFLLRDSEFRKPILAALEENGFSAEEAVRDGIRALVRPLESSESAFLREKIADFHELGERLLRQLTSKSESLTEPETGSILVSYEAGPSLLASFRPGQVAGVVTEAGGAASHLAIMARGMGLPAVSGVKSLCTQIRAGDTVLVDGRSGFVFLNPGADLVELYRQTEERRSKVSERICKEGRNLSDCSLPVRIEASLGLPSEALRARENALDSVGLFRSEFVFMQASNWPDVEEQTALYSDIAEAFSGSVTVRTLDIGGDKMLPYHEMPNEENPLLGLRSIRFSMEYQDRFREQLQALVRCWKIHQGLRILLPMVSSLWELEAARDLLGIVCEEENVEAGKRPALGIMVEVPGILYQLDSLARYADFLSLGTNDLVQYLLAVDRNSATVNHLYSEAHPAVLGYLKDFLARAEECKLQVTVCGEMAGTVGGVLSLLALGYRNFSLRPEQAPVIRHLCNRVEASALNDLAVQILSEPGSAEIEKILQHEVARIDPLLSESD